MFLTPGKYEPAWQVVDRFPDPEDRKEVEKIARHYGWEFRWEGDEFQVKAVTPDYVSVVDQIVKTLLEIKKERGVSFDEVK